MSNLIKQLREKGFTKYRIAKEVGVTWQTVNMWEKGVFVPKPDKLEKLSKLYQGQTHYYREV